MVTHFFLSRTVKSEKIDLKFCKFIKDFFQDTSIYPPSFKKHGIL